MSTMYTYRVKLIRTDPKAGNKADMTVEVKATNGEMAKKTAEGQWPGYRAAAAGSRVL